MAYTEKEKLKKVLSFWDVFFIAAGQIIGAGVIALTGIAIGMTGPSVILAYLGAAVLILVASLLFMMGGAAIPATGAFYVWPSRMVNGWLASFVLWLVLLNSVTMSLYGGAFGLYINPLFPQLSANNWGVIIVTLFFAVNYFGVKIGAGLQMVLVVILFTALAVYAGFAIPEIRVENMTPMFPKGAIGFFTAMALLIFATGGAYLIVALGGEMKNPQKDIPRIVVFSTLGIAVLYCFVALAAVGVVPWQTMVNQPLTVAGKAFLPGWAMIYFLICGAGLAICTTLNAQYLQLPRNFLPACWDNVLPARFGKINKYGTPQYILFALYAIGVIPLLFDLKIDVIAKAATISAILPVMFVFWSLTKLPEKFPVEYQNSSFKLGKKWIWIAFVISELCMSIGIVFLAHDLSVGVLAVLAVWIVIAISYYPIRKRYLIGKGIDLDQTTRDTTIFQ